MLLAQFLVARMFCTIHCIPTQMKSEKCILRLRTSAKIDSFERISFKQNKFLITMHIVEVVDV